MPQDEPIVTGADVQAEENIVQALADLKRNSVSKEEYDRVLKLNKDLVDQMVNGQEVETNVETNTNYDDIIKESQTKLFSGDADLSNLEFCETTLKLRDAVLAKTGEDIFVGRGHKISPDASDYEKAENVATVIRECIEYANGDSEIFTMELQRRTNDVSLPNKKRK